MKLIDNYLLQKMCAEAACSDRKRTHLNFHATSEDSVQRLLIALQPETYIAPHRHLQAWKWELLVVLQGAVRIQIFDDDAYIIKNIDLQPGNACMGLELPALSWHSLVCTRSGTVIMEIKPGPYDQKSAAEFASWAPNEGDAACHSFQQWALIAQQGEKWVG